MKRKSTEMAMWMWLFYLICVLGSTLFAFYEYRRSQQEQKEEVSRQLIFPNLKPNEVQSIVINQTSITEKRQQKKILLFRKGEGWRIKSPLQDIADTDIVGDWLTTLLAEKVQLIKKEEVNQTGSASEQGLEHNQLSEDKESTGSDSEQGLEQGSNRSSIDWAEYGLDKNINTITMTTKDKKTLKINISHYSAFDGHFYIQKEGALLLGGTGWASLTSKKEDYFRSYKIINAISHPTFIEYSSPSFSAHLKWSNYSWQWDKGEQTLAPKKTAVVAPATLSQKNRIKGEGTFPLSQSKLESYWSAFKNISFETETYPNIKSFRKKFKLNKQPLMKLRIGFQNKSFAKTEDKTEDKAENKTEDKAEGRADKPESITPESKGDKTASSKKIEMVDQQGPKNNKKDRLSESISESILEIKISPQIENQFYVQISNRSDIFILSRDNMEKLILTEEKIREDTSLEKPIEKTTEKTIEKTTEKTTEETTGKTTGKTTEKPTEETTENLK